MMAGDSVLDGLERLRAALSAANTQALERERLRLADVGWIQEAFLDALEAFAAAVKPVEPPPVVTPPAVTPRAATAPAAAVTQTAALISGAVIVPVKPPQPSVGGLDFSSLSLKFSNIVVRWDGR
jgi:hypothetical protein